MFQKIIAFRNNYLPTFPLTSHCKKSYYIGAQQKTYRSERGQFESFFFQILKCNSHKIIAYSNIISDIHFLHSRFFVLTISENFGPFALFDHVFYFLSTFFINLFQIFMIFFTKNGWIKHLFLKQQLTRFSNNPSVDIRI